LTYNLLRYKIAYVEEENYLTTPQVAERLGVSIRRVQALIKAGRLPSKQFGRDHVILETDLALVAERKVGRPKKAKATVATAVEDAKPRKEAVGKKKRSE
jgi:excisionase family DNA binding protein